jgi:hypothetical protein
MSLWDLYQHAQIRGIRASQHLADSESLIRDRRHDRRADELEDRVEQLSTVVEALWSLCRDKLGLTDEQLTQAVEATLAEQAAERAAGPVKCVSCGAAVSIELERCQFCGTESPRPKSAFD